MTVQRQLMLMVLWVGLAQGQTFTWTRIAPELPQTIRVFQGIAMGPIYAWYAEIDYTDTTLTAQALVSSASGGSEAVSSFAQRTKAYVAINGGFFGSGQSYSLVVTDGSLAARQIGSVTRTAGSYPLVRANFGVMNNRGLQTAWIYHFGSSVSDIYKYSSPLQHSPAVIAPAPLQQNGNQWTGVRNAIGGGPNLVSNGLVNVTYNEEVMFDSGVGKDNGDPRTAIGLTPSGKIIVFVVDGRRNGIGMSLPQVANVMIQLGCVEAINLDGGGSSTFYAGGATRNTPSDGSERPVASAFVIAPSTKNQTSVPAFERTMDTNDPLYNESGSGWFSSANPGYFGSQPARLYVTGGGEGRATFRISVPKKTLYDLYAWWVAASNRATNTPFIVYTAGKSDTVRVDQTTGGSAWSRIGTYVFGGGTSDSVVISNQAQGKTSPAHVVADGLRLVSYDSSLVTAVPVESRHIPSGFALSNNYPNPFNPTTMLEFRVSSFGFVELKIFDVLGRGVATLVNDSLPPGSYAVRWDASAVPSGIYFCRLSAHNTVETRKMVFVK
jgi:hypothetical protein